MISTVILAAGSGTRLKPHTRHKPKCLVKIQNKTLLDWQLDKLNESGISNISLVGGYKINKIKNLNDKRIKKIYFNKKYHSTNMVKSLLIAKELFYEDLIITYADIIYSHELILKLINSDFDNAILVDLEWLKLWSKRFKNPLDDAESLKFDNNFNLTEIGLKSHSIENIMAQYIGIIKFNNNTLNYIKKLDSDGLIQNNMYMTELLNKLVNDKIKIKVVPIRRKWIEIDSTNDLEIYENELKKTSISVIDIFK